MTQYEIRQATEAYWTLGELLREARAESFPPGTVCSVDCPRYHGPGIVSSLDLPPDMIGVRLENGNVWNYPVKDCTPLPRKQWPGWIRREMRRRARR